MLSFFALAYVVPLSIIASMYVLILRFLRARRRQSMISSSRSAAAGPAGGERRRTSYASRVFLAVVVVFGVCWLPLHANLLLVYMGRQPHARWYHHHHHHHLSSSSSPSGLPSFRPRIL